MFIHPIILYQQQIFLNYASYIQQKLISRWGIGNTRLKK